MFAISGSYAFIPLWLLEFKRQDIVRLVRAFPVVEGDSPVPLAAARS
jgi:hypothetical protein